MYRKYIKRILDFTLSLIALIVLSPILLITAILVKIKLGSPIIFKQQRPGKNEKIFTLYKFRTMTDKKDEEGHIIRQERYYGSAKRSFYVGDQITKEDIQAKYDKGILNIFVPKKEVKKIEGGQVIEIQ